MFFFLWDTVKNIKKILVLFFVCYLVLLFHSLYNITSYSSSSKEYKKNSEHAFVIFHIPFFLWCRGAFFLWLVCRFFSFIQPNDYSQIRRFLWVHVFILFSLHSRLLEASTHWSWKKSSPRVIGGKFDVAESGECNFLKSLRAFDTLTQQWWWLWLEHTINEDAKENRQLDSNKRVYVATLENLSYSFSVPCHSVTFK